MVPGLYRFVVLGSALAWLLLGLHLPALHQVTHHDATLHWSVMAAIGALAAAGVVGVWVLLRAPRRWGAGGG
jgi:hypothetical protein